MATPITWEELVSGARPESFNLLNLPARLQQLALDPWDGFFELRQRLPE